MAWMLQLLVLLKMTAAVSAGIRYLPDLPMTRYERPGELLLGIVVPVHRFHKTLICSQDIRELGALHRVEAMAFAVEEINSRSDLLPNITLGFIMLDDCSKGTSALVRSLHFIQETNVTECDDQGAVLRNKTNGLYPLDVVGVVGSESSRNTVQMADILSIFKVPLVSYLSTSPLLSDKESYGYFSRIVPSDRLQAKVIADLVAFFNFTYVSIVYVRGSYGTEGYKAVKARLEEMNLCVAMVKEVQQSSTEKDYDKVVDNLISNPRAKAVVIFGSLLQATALMKAVQRRKASGRLTWLGSDGWGRNIQDYAGIEEAALGAITIKFHASKVERFHEHFRQLSVASRPDNPWFPEFVESNFGCSFRPSANQTQCSLDQTFSELPSLQWETTVALAMDAVYTFGHALHNVTSACPPDLRPDPKACVKAGNLLKAIRETRFQGERGQVVFDSVGDGNAVYQVQTLVRTGVGYELVTLGLWDSSLGDFTLFRPELVEWNPLILEEGKDVPVSTCSDLCPVGQEAVRTQPSCCWYCQPCRVSERTEVEDGLPKCVPCPSDNFTWPDEETRTRCEPIESSYVSVAKVTGMVILGGDLLVALMALATLVLFLRHNSTRLIKACSRELVYLILIGIFLSCVLVALSVTRPSTPTCVITYLGFHLTFAMTYGPLTVKTNRIYRIFTTGRRSKQRPPLVDSRSQVIFALTIVLAQVGLSVAWLVADPPRAEKVMPNPTVRYVEEICLLPQTGFLASLVYNLTLVVVCAFYAVKTRSLPDNYNESKYISFCVYTTMILWLAFTPTYFTTSKAELRVLALSTAMITNSVVMLLFLFFPKIYALYYVASDEQHLQVTLESQKTRSFPAITTVSAAVSGPAEVPVVTSNRVSPIAPPNGTPEASKTSVELLKEISDEGN